MPNQDISEMLRGKFRAGRSIDAVVRHFEGVVDEYHKREWEKSLGKAGKFLEAVLKSLLGEAGLPAQTGRGFKVDKAINDLGGVAAGTLDDAIRITIPRCCRFMYDVTSNRGGRHDPDEIDPNEMDATAMLTNCAWVLAEMVRYAQKSLDPERAKAIVEGLMKRKYPFFEDIDGREYVDLKLAKSARDLGLLILLGRGPRRISRPNLAASIRRQSRRITADNARKGVERLHDLVDDDGDGNLRLRAIGVREAERLMDSGGADNATA